jgi:hypothetical protein
LLGVKPDDRARDALDVQKRLGGGNIVCRRLEELPGKHA